MKSTFWIAVVLVVVNSLALALWSRAAAPPTPVSFAQPTRVAVLNLAYVLKNYEKSAWKQNELKKLIAPYQKRYTEYKATREAINKELQEEDISDKRKTAIETKLKRVEGAIEDNKDEGRALLVKAQEKQLKELYTDVEEAARRLARSRGFDLVLHYNDPGTEQAQFSPQSIIRKHQSGALKPIYTRPGIDISQGVLEDLNDRIKLERR